MHIGAVWPSLSPCTVINPILLTYLLMHICVTQPQWVKRLYVKFPSPVLGSRSWTCADLNMTIPGRVHPLIMINMSPRLRCDVDDSFCLSDAITNTQWILHIYNYWIQHEFSIVILQFFIGHRMLWDDELLWITALSNFAVYSQVPL